MKSVFIGTVDLSRACLERLISLDHTPAGVVTRAASTFHADYADLTTVCAQANIPVHHTRDVNAHETIDWIKAFAADVIFCFGWSQLLSDEILTTTQHGVIGYHPTLLPRHRGRHPIIWALALGLNETGSTFFFMDGGADSGDIVSQRRVTIGNDDDAGSLYRKLTECALDQMGEFVPKLALGRCPRIPQDHSRASYWRKRSASDGRIDWRMPTGGICNLVRALTKPYPGATVLRGTGEQIVWRARPNSDESDISIEPGRVLKIADQAIVVKTGDGAISLLDHEILPLPQKGEFL